jgi:hypothetical protein
MPRGAPRSAERKARATEFKRLFEAFGVTGRNLSPSRLIWSAPCGVYSFSVRAHGSKIMVHIYRREFSNSLDPLRPSGLREFFQNWRALVDRKK